MGLLGKILSMFSNGPAIQNLERFDMVIEMKDGGVLLPIITSQHLDNSEGNIELLRTKVKNYTEMLQEDKFKEDFPLREYCLIELNCIDKPHELILQELDSYEKKYAHLGVQFSWKK